MEERKALETQVSTQGAARGVSFPCPCPVGPSPMDTGARFLILQGEEKAGQG